MQSPVRAKWVRARFGFCGKAAGRGGEQSDAERCSCLTQVAWKSDRRSSEPSQADNGAAIVTLKWHVHVGTPRDFYAAVMFCFVAVGKRLASISASRDFAAGLPRLAAC